MTRSTRITLAVLVFCAASTTGSAQVAAQSTAPQDQPSPTTATALAVTTFVAPLAYMAYKSGHQGPPSEMAPVAFATTLLAPMVGYAYGGIPEEGLAPLGRRVLVLGGTVGVMSALCAGGQCGLFSDNSNTGTAVFVGLAGTIMFTYMTVSDMVHVSTAVREHNAKQLSVIPVWVPAQRAPGVGVSLRF